MKERELVCPNCTRPVRPRVAHCPWCKHHRGLEIASVEGESSREWRLQAALERVLVNAEVAPQNDDDAKAALIIIYKIASEALIPDPDDGGRG